VAGWLGSGGSARAGWVSELRQGRPGGRGWKGGKLLRGLGERKVEDSYVRYPIPQRQGQPVPRDEPPGVDTNQATWKPGGGGMYFRTLHVLCSTTCPRRAPLITAGQGRRVSGVAVLRCAALRMRRPNRSSFAGEICLALSPLLPTRAKVSAITETGRCPAGVPCASADWGEGDERRVVEDPCPRLHGRFDRRRVVGCVKCRFRWFPWGLQLSDLVGC
jgi:hypothetical protein